MKKLLCSLLCVGLLTSFSVLPAAAAGSGEQPEETVRFLLTLDSPSLLDYVLSDDTVHTVRDLICSPEGKRLYDTILARQEEVRTAIWGQLPAADFSQSRSFCAVTNGICFSAPLSARKALERLEGVRSVEIAGEEEFRSADRITAVGTDEERTVFGDAYKSTFHADEAYDEGYTGKNMLVAVIDSEFDLSHEVFSVKPPDITYDRNYLRFINQITPLNIDPKYTLDDTFYNGKILYAYDYGENDTDCADALNYHGTHVAAIAAGNSGKDSENLYHGVAYDAQLALLKICDTQGQLRDEAIVAALDDAVKLGPDVINCSFGARKYLQYEYEGKSLYEKLTETGIAVIAAAGNEGFNGYGAGFETIPADYVQYGTVGTPSNMDGVFSVAASQPDKLYQHSAIFTFNNENEVYARICGVYIEDVEELVPIGEETTARRRKNVGGEEDEEAYDEDEDDNAYQYIYLDADGSEKSFEGIFLHGEYLILNRGKVPFQEMLKNAILHGCVGLAVIDNDEPVLLDAENEENSDLFLLPSSQKDYLTAHPTGKVTVDIDPEMHEADNPRKGKMTDFSSMGVRSDLTLKPELAAPGDNILSAAYDHTYMDMSGTSMATPCVTGMYALMKQYLNETDLAETLSTDSLEELIYRLLMSTAEPLVAEEASGHSPRTYYSPRSQGAGVPDLGKAIRTRAYLSADGKRPKISLKDSAEGVYSFTFRLHNLSPEPASYQLSTVLQTDGYRTETSKKTQQTYFANTLLPVSILDRAQVRCFVNGETADTVTVPGNDEVSIAVEIRLDRDLITENSKVFTNGFYVDGFVFLRSEELPSLSLPFTGFCGDWSKGPIFTANAYEEDELFPNLKGGLSAAILIDRDVISLPLGVNTLGYEELPTELSFGTNSVRNYSLRNPDLSGAMLLPDLDLLRDTMDYTISVTDTAGQLLYQQNYGSIPSSMQMGYRPVLEFGDLAFRKFLEDYEPFCAGLFESRYTYTVTASTVGSNGNPGRSESRSFQIRVDNTAPVITNVYLEKQEDERLLLHVTAFDEGLLQGIELFAVKLDEDGDVENRVNILADMKNYEDGEPFYSVEFDPDSHYYTFTYDVTDYKDFIREMKSHQNEIFIDDNITIEFETDNAYEPVSDNVLCLRAVDYAYNTSEMELINVDHYGIMELQFLDEHGKAPGRLTVEVNGQQFVTDQNGKLTLYQLSLGGKTLSLVSDQYRFADHSDLVVYTLTPRDFHLTDTVLLQEIPRPTPIDDRTKPDQKPDDRPLSPAKTDPEPTVIFPNTGDAGGRTCIPILLLLLSAGTCVFLLTTRRTGRD